MPRTPFHPGLLLYAIIPETLYFIQCYLLVAPQSSFSRIVRAVIGLVAGPWLAVLPFVIKWAPSDLIIPNVVISERLFEYPITGELTQRFFFWQAGVFLCTATRVTYFGFVKDSVVTLPLKSRFWAALELTYSVRGVGNRFSKDAGIRFPASPYDVSSRPRWVRQVLMRSILPGYLVYLAINFVVINTDALRILERGGSMGDFSFVQKTVTKLCGPLGAIMVIGMAYDWAAILCVVVLGDDPATWPPLFGNPWLSTSLHDFWSVQWHQVRGISFSLSLVLTRSV